MLCFAGYAALDGSQWKFEAEMKFISAARIKILKQNKAYPHCAELLQSQKRAAFKFKIDPLARAPAPLILRRDAF